MEGDSKYSQSSKCNQIMDINNKTGFCKMIDKENTPIQPVSGKIVPRYAGPSNFARLPELRDENSCYIAILGILFDSGTS